MKHSLSFPGFEVETARSWDDITHTLSSPHKPFTIAKADGVGVVQFSPALYRRGPLPSPTKDDLLSLVRDFGRDKDLGDSFDEDRFKGPLTGAAASYASEGDLIRVWYVSDGKNIMLITYICEWECRHQELAECEQIVRSVRFRKKV